MSYRKGWDGTWPDESVPRSCRLDIRAGGFLKEKFVSKEAAEATLTPGMKAYECPNCGSWHTAHKRKHR